jgi:hypothetical protein
MIKLLIEYKEYKREDPEEFEFIPYESLIKGFRPIYLYKDAEEYLRVNFDINSEVYCSSCRYRTTINGYQVKCSKCNKFYYKLVPSHMKDVTNV